MKYRFIHIKLLLLIIGIFSIQQIVSDSLLSPDLFIEVELEESVDDINEFNFEDDVSYSDSNGGNNSVLAGGVFLKNPFKCESDFTYAESKDLSKKLRLFILYCCFKVDC